MRGRALSVISLTFALLLFGRAYDVSSEISSTTEPSLENAGQNISNDTVGDTKSNQDSAKKGESTAETCLGTDISEILMADSLRLEQRTTIVNEREAVLEKLETTLKTQLAAIETANAELDKKISGLRAGANEDLAHLVGMYQTMKPKQAATIFDSMDPAFAAGFLREMNSNTAGLIMANMDAKKSYSISVLIAQKNAKYR